MKRYTLAFVLFASSLPLLALDLSLEVKKLLTCVDIVNNHIRRIESGASKADPRLMIKRFEDRTEYGFDKGIVLKSLSNGRKLEFSMGTAGFVRVEMDVSKRAFLLVDRDGKTIKGDFTMNADGKMASASITQASPGFAQNEIADASVYLFKIGIVAGIGILVY